MANQSRPTGRDWIVTLASIALALMSLGAVGEMGRKRAKEVVCRASLRQWGSCFLDYTSQNDGKFYSGCDDRGHWWPMQLPHELQDWTKNRTWFCPRATKPAVDSRGVVSPEVTIFNAWGIYAVNDVSPITYRDTTYTMNPNGLSGSYGLNGYVIPIPEDKSTYARYPTFESGVPAADGWRNLLEVPHGNTVPMFLDSMRYDLWPRSTDPPAASESTPSTTNYMARSCINRHDGAVNCLFVDGSVRKVGLKELWTLKWYRRFDTAGPWTRAGGAIPYDWPKWMAPLKGY